MQCEVVHVNPPVQGSHDGAGVIRMLQTQSVAELVDSDQEEIYACGARQGTNVSFASTRLAFA